MTYPSGTHIIKTHKGHKIHLHDGISIETPYGKAEYINLEWESMAELDEYYNVIRSYSIQQRVKDWTKPTSFDYNDPTTGQPITVIEADFSKTLPNGATLNAILWILTTHSTTINWLGVDVPVPANSVKISFNVSNWQFQNGNNFLSVGLRLYGSGGRHKHPVVRRPHKHRHDLQFGIGILRSLTTALYDGMFAGPVAIHVSPARSSGVHVEYVFYSFVDSVHYDPVFGEDSGSLLLISWPCITLSVLLSLFHL